MCAGAAVMMLALFLAGTGCDHSIVYHQTTPREGPRRAVLVLIGLRQSARGWREMRRYYPSLGYDVYIPEYYSRDGLEATRRNLSRFIEEHHLAEYDELYVFDYILGAWVFNQLLAEQDLPNLRAIIIDRSPMQEDASRIVVGHIPHTIHTFYGDTVREFSETPYPPVSGEGRHIGIIVECRATPYARRHRDELTPVEGEGWLPEGLGQPDPDDVMYVHLHHDEMYYSFDQIGEEIRSFFRNGRFTEGARRQACHENPFD